MAVRRPRATAGSDRSRGPAGHQISAIHEGCDDEQQRQRRDRQEGES